MFQQNSKRLPPGTGDPGIMVRSNSAFAPLITPLYNPHNLIATHIHTPNRPYMDDDEDVSIDGLLKN